jgi:hypothetical protein
MRIRDSHGIYHVLETLLRDSKTPLTCVDLYDDATVRQFSESVSRTSDYLGHMFRRGILGRTPAPKSTNSQARWAYFLKDEARPKAGVQVLATQIKSVSAAPTPAATVGVPRSLLKKPSIEITEDGGVITIDLPQLTVSIRIK